MASWTQAGHQDHNTGFQYSHKQQLPYQPLEAKPSFRQPNINSNYSPIASSLDLTKKMHPRPQIGPRRVSPETRFGIC